MQVERQRVLHYQLEAWTRGFPLLSNPFKIIAEREAKERSERQLEQKKKRALKKAQKKKK